MKRIATITSLMIFVLLGACDQVLEPRPVALLSDEIALNEPNDVNSARIGMYAALRGTAAPRVIAGDFTADLLIHNGTFTQYRELSNKEITPSNATVNSMWSSLYGAIYVANIILEKLPGIPGVDSQTRDLVTAEAYFVRGYCYFTLYTTFGKAPIVLTTDLTTNRNIPRSPANEVLNQSIDDLVESLNGLPIQPVNAGFLSRGAANAALARLSLYAGDYDLARDFANDVINSGEYELESSFQDIVLTDFTDEAILEMGYSAADDPGTSTLGLNNLFIGRREIIPSNEAIFALNSTESGDRSLVISFDLGNLAGTDNGWSVAKYGTADENNNNIILFRLAEMYLIRAEASVELNDLTTAEDDINTLRMRANAPTISALSSSQMRMVIEEERLYELAYEGHRWYDLKRTGRVNDVMTAFSPNWRDAYELWPVPQREIQNNPALAGDQNAGY